MKDVAKLAGVSFVIVSRVLKVPVNSN
ncbi:LacI family DNA-binding transcriptional regulator [Bacillus sp. NPDC077411]